MPYDSRIIANSILELRRRRGFETSNLELQKLLYFCHAYYLREKGEKLVTGVFEAWKNGPVNPSVYKAFKHFGAKSIDGFAKKKNYKTNQTEELPIVTDVEILNFIDEKILGLSKFSAWQLVALSHTKGGPWDHVVTKGKVGISAGMRITDEITERYFTGMKRSIKPDDSLKNVNSVELKPFG